MTDRAPYIAFHLWDASEQAYILGVFNSTPFDWQARRSVETTLNYFILNSLTFPPPDNTPWEQIGRLAARLSCVDERFAEFAEEAGVECGQLTDGQRSDMRAEIDALVARAYDLTVDEAPLHLHRLHRERGQPSLPMAGAGEVRGSVGKSGVT